MAVFESRSDRYRRAKRGFTLLEVLIAFAILAVALTALMQAFSQGMRNLEVAENYATAAMLARSKMAEIGAAISVEEGEHSGEFEDGWQWRVVVFPYRGADGAVGALEDLPLYTVEVSVGRDETPLAQLRSLRMGAAQ